MNIFGIEERKRATAKPVNSEGGLADLDPFEKSILQLCSVIYGPTDKATIEDCAGRCGLGVIRVGIAEGRSVGLAVERLYCLGLLDADFRCRPKQVEKITKAAVSEGAFAELCAAVRRTLSRPDFEGPKSSLFLNGCLRELRIGIYNHDLDQFNRCLLPLLEHRTKKKGSHPIVEICNNPFDIQWFAALPAQIQLYGLHEILKHSLLHFSSLDEPLAFLSDRKALARIPVAGRPSFYYILIVTLLLLGRIDKARLFIDEAGKEINSFGLNGFYLTILGRHGDAIEAFEEDLGRLREVNGSAKAYFTGLEGLYYLLALIIEEGHARIGTIRGILSSINEVQTGNVFLPAYGILHRAVDFFERPLLSPFSSAYTSRVDSRWDGITLLFLGVAASWLDNVLPEWLLKKITGFYKLATHRGFHLLAAEFAELLKKNAGEGPSREHSQRMRDEQGMVPVVSSLRFEEPWQRALKALGASGVLTSARANGRTDVRLAWCITQGDGVIGITPKEQKMRRSGSWTRGKAISLKKLVDPKKVAHFSEQDRRICTAVRNHKVSWGVTLDFDPGVALPAMVGHPFLYLDGPTPRPVELTAGKPEIRVVEEDGNFHITMDPEITDQDVMLLKEMPNRYKVIRINASHRQLSRVIGSTGMKIPLNARKKLLVVLGNISPHVTIHSEIDGCTDGARKIEADRRMYVQLQPSGKGFRMALAVKPFGHGGPYQKPGVGTRSVIAEVDGERLHAARDLEQEKMKAAEIESICPNLLMQEVGAYEWILDDPADCLQVLSGLQEMEKDVVVEWPEGKRLMVSPQVSFEHFRMKIKKKNNWFELQGHIRIDDSLMVDMKRILPLIHQTPSRFIPLGQGQFLALSEEFHKRLVELSCYLDRSGRKSLLHPLAAGAVREIAGARMAVETDSAWDEHIRLIESAGSIKPEIPSTFNAELRDYQVDGFHWLFRLAHLNIGGCLADDMGLGKTVQALAFVLAKAQGGPALVVAPTSVCMNWFQETRRFAPTLNPILLEGRKRKELIGRVKAFDLLIASYGMLQQEAELLASKEWETVILDEAQAIKNYTTKRSQAAKRLKGKFRFITTGTPVENHLGELWNLFHFINPGLLGSLEHFNERFAIPIEKNKSKDARRSLKRLIKPFILRRTKAQVLEELPPRTEIVLHVEMNKREAAFYETLRLEAVEKINSLNPFSRARHIQILAEIMKLRQACCNPQLISEEIDIPSSKMELFDTIMEELLRNRHKALVFSQFVGHLRLIRSHLDAKGITYQYLDGSTPQHARQKSVEAFQSGKGDFFLISLKAGGLGLNLTAADYVIHMDPWWNPAVEDQASDRAHRLGQNHPVTIYRMVVKNTIEEKIVRLHQEKRDLANSLLEGSDLSGKISTEDLVRLLKETMEK